MSKQKEMLIPQAILHAAHYFRQFGFHVLPAKANSISRYVRADNYPFKIRVANHPPKHPERYPDVIRSIVIREPMTKKAVEARCRDELAVFLQRVDKRRQAAAGETGRAALEGESKP